MAETLLIEGIPTTYKEAINSSSLKQWDTAMIEFQNLIKTLGN